MTNAATAEVDRYAALWNAEGSSFHGQNYNSLTNSILHEIVTSVDFLHIFTEGKKRFLVTYPNERDTDAFKKHMVSGVIALYEHAIAKIDRIFDERPEHDPEEFRLRTDQDMVSQTSDGAPIIIPDGVEKGEYVHYTTLYKWMNDASSDPNWKSSDSFLDTLKYKM